MSFIAPNWEVESEYPSHKDELSLGFWAWQFLRRNKEYQSDWKDYCDGLYRMAHRVPELKAWAQITCDENFRNSDEGASYLNSPEKWNELTQNLPEQVEYYEFEPPLKDGENIKDWQRRVENSCHLTARISTKTRAMAQKWGIEAMENPVVDFPRMKFSISPSTVEFFVENPYSGDDNYLAQAFDLRLPVAVLRSKFEFILKYRQGMIDAKRVVAYDGRPERSLPLFSNYLRVLDALSNGAGIPKIALSMLPNQAAENAKKVVRNWSVAASALRDGGYRFLPAHSALKTQEVPFLLPTGYGK